MMQDQTTIATTQHTDTDVDDRAIPGQDQRRSTPPEPLNRRGRRHLQAALRRHDRRTFRSLRRQALAGNA